MEKMTNITALEYVVDNFNGMPYEVSEKIKAILASYKKKSENRKPTATQEANEEVKERLIATLKRVYEPMTVTDIMKLDEELSQLSNQKVSALLRQLIDAGLVKKVVDKKKSYFILA